MGTCCEGFGKHWILSFHSCNVLRDCHRGVPRGNKNVVKIEIFGLTHWFQHRMTRKLLKKIGTESHCGLWWMSCLRILTKSPAIPQQLHKPASRGLSAIAGLLLLLPITAATDLLVHKILLWLGYPMVKNFRRYLCFDATHERGRHTHRQTDTAWQHRPRLCIASCGKKRPVHVMWISIHSWFLCVYFDPKYSKGKSSA